MLKGEWYNKKGIKKHSPHNIDELNKLLHLLILYHIPSFDLSHGHHIPLCHVKFGIPPMTAVPKQCIEPQVI